MTVHKNMINLNIRFLRTSNNVTQKDLAIYLEKAVSNVSSYERGTVTPPADILLMLSKRFKVSINDLLEKDLSLIENVNTEFISEDGKSKMNLPINIDLINDELDMNIQRNIRLLRSRKKQLMYIGSIIKTKFGFKKNDIDLLTAINHSLDTLSEVLTQDFIRIMPELRRGLNDQILSVTELIESYIDVNIEFLNNTEGAPIRDLSELIQDDKE